MRLQYFEEDASLQSEYLMNASYFGDYFKDTLRSVIPTKDDALAVKSSAIQLMVSQMDVSTKKATELVNQIINSVY